MPPISSSTTVVNTISPPRLTPISLSVSIAISMQATPPFISTVPLPRTKPSATTGVNGSLIQCSGAPGGTTSMWPVSMIERPPPLPLRTPAEIWAAFEGASLVGPWTAFVFRVKCRPVGIPEVGREAERLQAALKIKLAVALAWASVARIRLDDRRIAHELAERLYDFLRAALDCGCNRLFGRAHEALRTRARLSISRTAMRVIPTMPTCQTVLTLSCSSPV